MRILVAAGGTGGHIYPALAVLRSSLEQRHPDLEVRWLGGRRGLESDDGALRRLSIRPAVAADAAHRRCVRGVDARTRSVWQRSIPQAMAYLLRWRPDVVYTTGGYVAIPVLMAAATLRVPSLLWEGNRLAGRSVRATTRLASVIAVTFPSTAATLLDPRLCHGHAHPGIRRA